MGKTLNIILIIILFVIAGYSLYNSAIGSDELDSTEKSDVVYPDATKFDDDAKGLETDEKVKCEEILKEETNNDGDIDKTDDIETEEEKEIDEDIETKEETESSEADTKEKKEKPETTLPPGTIKIKENEVVSLKVDAYDEDGDKLTITYPPKFSKEGTWKTTYSDAGEYKFIVKVTDGQLTTEEEIKVIVEDVNRLPIISGPSTIKANEGDMVDLKQKATDPDNDKLTVTYSEPFDNNGRWQTDSESAGEKAIKVSASDGKKKVTKTVTVTIEDRNHEPVVENIKDIVAKETDTVRIKPKVTDADGDKIIITYSKPFDKNGEWKTDYDSAGEYTVTVTISDGSTTSTEEVKVTIQNVNRAPVITGIYAG